MRYTNILVATVLWVSMCQAMAATGQQNLDADAIREQQKQIRADVEARKGIYRRLNEAQRTRLLQQQDKVDGLLPGNVQATTELSEADRIALFNALETIEAIVNNTGDERMVCERHKPTGSKRPTTVCKTVAQRKAEREAGQQRVIERTQSCFQGSADPLTGGCGPGT
jgi:phosphoenolpyruvate carboxylase